MKNYKVLFFLTLLLININFAQIDTTDWYPLQTGNKWFYTYYYANTSKINKVEVIGDTLMPNNKTYKIVEGGNFSRYQRKDDNKFVYLYSVSDTSEHLLYDFVSPDLTRWDLNYMNGWQFCVNRTFKGEYLPIMNSTEFKEFDWVWIDTTKVPPDTIWGPDLDLSTYTITKGIGRTSTRGFSFEELFHSAIINGDTLGTIPVGELNVQSDSLYFLYHLGYEQIDSISNNGRMALFIDSLTLTDSWSYELMLNDKVLLPNQSIEIKYNETVLLKINTQMPLGSNYIIDTLTIYYSYDDVHRFYDIILFTDPALTAVNKLSELLNNFYLSQNYPNPFNPATTIEYTLPESSLSGGVSGGRGRLMVTLKVYDILGREVATLINETKEAGTYGVTFEASHLSSGVYFYRLQAGEYSQTKKMVLMK